MASDDSLAEEPRGPEQGSKPADMLNLHAVLLIRISKTTRKQVIVKVALSVVGFLLAVTLGMSQEPPASTWLDTAQVIVLVTVGMLLLGGICAGQGQFGAAVVGLSVGGSTLGATLASIAGVMWGLAGCIMGCALGALLAMVIVKLLDNLNDEVNALQQQLQRVHAHLHPESDDSQRQATPFAARRISNRFNKAS